MGNFISNEVIDVRYINSNSIKDKWLIGILNEVEYKRYKEYSVEKARKEFLFGRYLLKSVLSEYLNINPERIILRKNEYGKLFLDEKHHQVNIKFNLSHSDGFVVGVFTLENDVGIDIEKIGKNISNIVRRFFSLEEKEYINCISNNFLRKHLAYQIWTLKEAYLKAKGIGLNISLNSFSVFRDLGVFFYTTLFFFDYYLSIAVNNPKNKEYIVNIGEFTL